MPPAEDPRAENVSFAEIDWEIRELVDLPMDPQMFNLPVKEVPLSAYAARGV